MMSGICTMMKLPSPYNRSCLLFPLLLSLTPLLWHLLLGG
jgi:hypothetical protein